MLWWEALIHKRLSIALENESLSTENIYNLDILKKALTENKDNLASSYADLETDQNIQKLVVDWSHYESGFQTEARVASIITEGYTAALYYT